MSMTDTDNGGQHFVCSARVIENPQREYLVQINLHTSLDFPGFLTLLAVIQFRLFVPKENILL